MFEIQTSNLLLLKFKTKVVKIATSLPFKHADLDFLD